MKRKAMDVADLSRIPTCAEFARLKQELELLRAKLPKWHRCDEPDEDGFFDLPPESGSYFAQYETTWADGVTRRYCEPLKARTAGRLTQKKQKKIHVVFGVDFFWVGEKDTTNIG